MVVCVSLTLTLTPASRRPLEIISAETLAMILSEIPQCNAFHEDQPIGGVRATVAAAEEGEEVVARRRTRTSILNVIS